MPGPRNQNEQAKYYWLGGIAILAVLLVLLLPKALRNREISKLKASLPPAVLADGAGGAKIYKPKPSADFATRPTENLQTGLRYETNKTHALAASEFYQKLSADGWLAIAGSTQTGDKTILKMRKGDQVIFLILSGGKPESADSNKTLVSIVPVAEQNP